jgi:hypothetical protein
VTVVDIYMNFPISEDRDIFMDLVIWSIEQGIDSKQRVQRDQEQYIDSMNKASWKP